MANKKIRHHIVPKFYLKGFIDPNNKPFIWMYEKGNPDIIKATAKDIAVQKNYYSYTNPDGAVDSGFEDILEKIETPASKVFRKIENYQNLDMEDRGNFALFLRFMRTRVPNFRENVENSIAELANKFRILIAANPEVFNSNMDSLERHKGIKLDDIQREELRQYMLAGECQVNPKLSLGLAAASAIDIRIYKIFFYMNRAFLIAPADNKFITCDNPVYYNEEVTFPITKDIAFLGTWKNIPTGYLYVNEKVVENVNRNSVISASRFVFSSQKSEELNNLVQKDNDFSLS